MGGPKTRISQVRLNGHSSCLPQGYPSKTLMRITNVHWKQESFDSAVRENQEEFGMEVLPTQKFCSRQTAALKSFISL